MNRHAYLMKSGPVALSRPYDECHSRACMGAGVRVRAVVIPCCFWASSASGWAPNCLFVPLLVCLSVTVLGRLPHATVICAALPSVGHSPVAHKILRADAIGLTVGRPPSSVTARHGLAIGELRRCEDLA